MADRQPGKWTFGLLWTVANILGWGLWIGLGMAAGWLVWTLYEQGGYPRLLHNEVARGFLTLMIAGLCWGAVLGGLQQFVLKRRFRLEGSQWVWATITGIVLHVLIQSLSSLLLTVVPYSMSSHRVLDALVSWVPPLALGMAQWVVLRRHWARSGWWVGAVVLALWLPSIAFLAFQSGPTTLSDMLFPSTVQGFAYGLATFAVLSVITVKSSE